MLVSVYQNWNQRGDPILMPATESLALPSAVSLCYGWEVARASAHTKESLKRTKNQLAIVSLDRATIFRNYSAAHHGVNGSGDGPTAPATKPRILLLSHGETEAHFPPLAFEASSQATKLWRRVVHAKMPISRPILDEIENDQDLGSPTLAQWWSVQDRL
jgi:hypothetical protein